MSRATMAASVAVQTPSLVVPGHCTLFDPLAAHGVVVHAVIVLPPPVSLPASGVPVSDPVSGPASGVPASGGPASGAPVSSPDPWTESWVASTGELVSAGESAVAAPSSPPSPEAVASTPPSFAAIVPVLSPTSLQPTGSATA